jgi:hypothetical protein
MVLTAYFVLSLVSRAFLPPSQRDAKHHRQLTPASGRQDHTSLPSAGNPSSPNGFAGQSAVRLRHPASTASRLTFRDDSAYAPLVEVGRLQSLMLCLANRQAKYFLRRGSTLIRGAG